MSVKHVYIDVENTLTVSFLSGIQRVTIELVHQLTKLSDQNWRFVPVRHCPMCKGWIRIDPGQLSKARTRRSQHNPGHRVFNQVKRFVSSTPLKGRLRPAYKWLTHPKHAHAEMLIPKFERDSVFLDMDSSWHNNLKRSLLLPRLHEQGVNIATFHYDAIPVLMPELTHDNTVRVFNEHFRAHLKHSDLFICISKTVEKDLLSLAKNSKYRKSGRTDTIRLGDFEVNNAEQNPQWPLPEKTSLYLLYVATIEPRKNHTVLLDAFDKLSSRWPEVDVVLVGRQGWYADNIVQRVVRHPLFNNRIFWLDNISDSTLGLLYKRAFLCVSTSLYEGFGLPLNEGLCHGCVTIASNSGAQPETAGIYADYIDPRDTNQLYLAIEKYLEDREFYQQRKNQLSNRRLHSWSDTAQQIVTVLNRHFS